MSAAPKGNCAHILYQSIQITPQQQPVRQLDDAEYQLLTELV